MLAFVWPSRITIKITMGPGNAEFQDSGITLALFGPSRTYHGRLAPHLGPISHYLRLSLASDWPIMGHPGLIPPYLCPTPEHNGGKFMATKTFLKKSVCRAFLGALRMERNRKDFEQDASRPCKTSIPKVFYACLCASFFPRLIVLLFVKS